MNLPKIETPKYTLTLPSTGDTIEYRPFLVKEEKILLIAQETGKQKDMIRAIGDIIKQCTFGKLDYSNMSTYDLEYVFLKLRAKSVGETSDISLKCQHCNTPNPISINLEEIELVKPEKQIDKKIMLTKDIGVICKHISAADLEELETSSKNTGEKINMTIIKSIESIFDKKGVYPTNEASSKDLQEFIDSLARSQISKIEEYATNVPKLQKEIEFICAKCGEKNNILLSGTDSFL